MRHKQRPIKSSRHKSVTSLNDCPQTTFEHNNVRHMNDVMRLAFLENNDISPETWKDTDFNSLSTASILKRNIQQQLQQQLKEQQLRAKQQELIQQQLFQKQQQLFRNQQLYQRAHLDDNDDDIDQSQVLIYDGGDDGIVDQFVDDHDDEQDDIDRLSQAQLCADDVHLYAGHSRMANNSHNNNYLLSDSRIFATAMPTTSYSRHNATTSTSTPARARRTAANNRCHTGQAIRNDAPISQPRNEHKIDSASKLSAKFTSKPQMTPGVNDSTSGEFMCDEPNCGKSFPSSRKLRHHKVVHSNDYPFHCQFKGCEKKFKRKFGIDLHSTTHFDLDPEMYAKTSNNSSLSFFGRRMQYSMCKPCGEKFKTVHDYQNHMLNHGKEPFKCPVKDCGQTFSIWKSFQKHRASHYFNYYCKMDPRCEHFTSNLQLLKLHIYCCHFQRKLPDNATLSSKDTQPAEELSPPMLDSSPSKRSRLSAGSSLIKQSPEKKFKQQITKEPEPGSDTELELEPEFEPSFESVPDDDENELDHDHDQEHEREDEQQLQFVSKIEPRSPVDDDDKLYLHDDSEQLQDEESLLKNESPSLGSPSHLDESMARSIANQSLGNFICDEPDCGKSFPSSRKLRHHKVVHSDEHPFHCQFKGCEKKFKRKFGIDLHSTTHFDLDPEMYAKTSNNSSLPFFGRRMQYSMCKPCGEKFKTVHDYQNHMLNHGKEPFKCPVKDCGQTFSIWKSFQKHRASHYFNYYCKMDPRCEHFTSNLQLLKLHIYCCHFQRKLPDNASLSSKDPPTEKMAPHTASPPSNKRSRVAILSQPKQTPEKESKLPLKVLPRRACTANSRACHDNIWLSI